MRRATTKYEGRYILQDGRPRAFYAWAYTKGDAAAAIESEARRVLGEDFRSARAEGVTRAEFQL